MLCGCAWLVLGSHVLQLVIERPARRHSCINHAQEYLLMGMCRGVWQLWLFPPPHGSPGQWNHAFRVWWRLSAARKQNNSHGVCWPGGAVGLQLQLEGQQECIKGLIGIGSRGWGMQGLRWLFSTLAHFPQLTEREGQRKQLGSNWTGVGAPGWEQTPPFHSWCLRDLVAMTSPSIWGRGGGLVHWSKLFPSLLWHPSGPIRVCFYACPSLQQFSTATEVMGSSPVSC